MPECAAPTRRHTDGLAAAKAVAIPGRCIFCEEELPPRRGGRHREVCGAPGCARAYHRAWRRDQRAGAPLSNARAGWIVRWHCGCGRSLQHHSFRQRHRFFCLFARTAFPIVVVPRGAAA